MRQCNSSPAVNNGPSPNLGEQATFYEEDSAQGRSYNGTVLWQTVMAAPGAHSVAEPVITAKIEIPERQMHVEWSLRRNPERWLSASHTIEVHFSQSANAANGPIATVPGVVVKETQYAKAIPLIANAAKKGADAFVIELSAVETSVKTNTALLKNREWIDTLLVYGDGHRGIVAIQKGPSGDRVFAEAFAAWEKSTAR